MSHLDEISIPDGTLVTDERKKRSETHKTYEYDNFYIPVGNVIACKDGGHRSEPWWVPPERIEDMMMVCKPFTDSGFTLHIGELEKSSSNPLDFEKGYKPQVIMSIMQERGTNKPFCPNTKGVPALVNDVMIWLTIDSVFKAGNILKERTDIPVALVADGDRYMTDDAYRKVYDMANELFMSYYITGTPVNLYSSKDDVERDMYDV